MNAPAPRRRHQHDDGFTLVELLVVITILGVLAAVVVFSVSAISNRADASACRAELTTLQRAVEIYRVSHPGNVVTDADLVSGGLLRATPKLYTVTAADTITARAGTACATTATTTAAAAAAITATTASAKSTPALVAASDWSVLRGSATITDKLIDARQGGYLTLVLKSPGTSTDQAISTAGTLYYGSGYGLWIRSTFDGAGAAQTGYSVQLDQAYGKLVVRQWSGGKECTVPLATADWAKGFSPFGEHTLGAAASGDALTVTLDGATALTIPSLASAVAKNTCGYPVATGTNMGLRTWGGAEATFTGTSVS